MNKRDRRATLLMRQPSGIRFAVIAMLGPVILAALLFWFDHENGRSETLRLQSRELFDRQVELRQILSGLKDAETAHRGDRPAALTLMRQGESNRSMDQLRAAIGTEIVADQRNLDGLGPRSLTQRTTTRRIALGSGASSILLLTALLYAVWRRARARFDALVAAFEAAERNETILDSTVDAMLILNPSGTIDAINAAATAMLGYGAGEIEHRNIAQVVDIAPGEGNFHQRVGLVAGQVRRSLLPDRSARHRDGHEVPVDVAIGVMALPSGDHLVLSLRDISERKRLEQLKDDLISTVSHELRTPLASVVGSLGLLRAGSAGELPEAAVRLVAIAENNSRRLIRLINDMLDIDRIEAGTLEMHREPIDLIAVVARATQGSEGLALAQDVRIVVARCDHPIIVMGDADRLLQVITNLLSNAIRFTPPGEAVRLSLEKDGGKAIVAIDDSGPGVPPEFRSCIFGRFERAAGEAGVQGGAGLGLAVSREIIARHDGRIWFEDAPGGGARFAFALDQMRPAT